MANLCTNPGRHWAAREPGGRARAQAEMCGGEGALSSPVRNLSGGWKKERESERDPGLAVPPQVLFAPPRPPLKASQRTPRPA